MVMGTRYREGAMSQASRLFALSAGCLVLRRLARRSGATDAEVYGSLPGDGVLPHPMLEWTRAATIDAPPDHVWPWIAQMGFGRGGWYTSVVFDRIVWRLENLSADRILPEWQDVREGDIIPDGPDFGAYFRVLDVVPGSHIVYRSIRHPFRPHPIDPDDGDQVERVERELVEGGVYFDFSWVFALRPADDHRTRLVVRTRADYEPKWFRPFEALGLVDLYHVSTMFRGIRRRATAVVE